MIFSIDDASLVIVFASLLLDQKSLSEIKELSSSNFLPYSYAPRSNYYFKEIIYK